MYIRMVGDTTKYHGKLERIGLHLIKVTGLIQNTTGFRLYLDNDVMVGDYSKFIYPYLDPHLGEGIFEYSDNNMDYEEEQHKPSKEEEEEEKIVSIVDKHWSNDLYSMTNQLVEMQDISIAMYEVLLDIVDRLPPTPNEDEEDEPIEKEPTEEEGE